MTSGRGVCAAAIVLLLCATGRSQVRPHPAWRNSLKPGVTQSSEPSSGGLPSGWRGPRRVGPELTLASNARTDYVILLPAEPTSQEAKAAAELAHWLQAMAVADMPIVQESPTAVSLGKVISVGRTERLAQAGVPEAGVALEDEGYAVSAKGGDLFLFGGRRRGPLYAVFALLEEDLGCRWYAVDRWRKEQHVTVPDRPVLVFQPVLRAYVPALTLRDPYYWDAFERDWSLRNRTNSGQHSAQLPEEWGGSTDFVRGYFVHTFERLVPVEEHVGEHPEYFSEWQGVRKPFERLHWPGQLCLTNREVLHIVKAKVREALRLAPQAEWISVSENDGRTGYCTCARCKSINDASGATSATLVRFVNAVGQALAGEFPDARATTLAYGHAYTPPRGMRVRQNVLIRFCTDQHAWRRPYRFITESENVTAAMTGWAGLGAKLTIWDYTADFGNYLQPRPNIAVAAENIRTYVRNNAVGVMLQGNYQSSGSSRVKLKCWVWSKLLWDPSLNVESLIRDFTYGYFGAAAEPMQRYNVLLWDAWERMHDGPTDNDGDPIDHALVRQAAGIIAEAEKLADSDALGRRIRREKLGILHARLQLGPTSEEDVAAYLAEVEEIESLVQEFRVSHMRERPRDVAERLLRWRARAGQMKVKTEVPGTVFADDLGLRLAKHLGEYAGEVVEDGLAGNGYAVRQSGRRSNWSLQWILPVAGLAEGRSYRLRVRQRLDKKGDTGQACIVGVYNPPAKKYGIRQSIAAADVPSDRYIWVTIGEFVPAAGDYVYVAPVDNGEMVENIFTDRLELQPVR